MNKNEQRICWYSSIVITMMMNSTKLLALRENGVIARYWHFNLAELIFQTLYNLVFCYLMFYLNLSKQHGFARYREKDRWGTFYSANIFFVLLNIIFGGSIQYLCFVKGNLPGLYWAGYFARFALSSVFIGILVKIILLLRESEKKEIENEQLKTAYMSAELELLKEQMNPHFLFNSLSSLSGVIREDPVRAQKYVRELSNVFRYTLIRSKNNLVRVEEELAMLRSFAQLIEMRLEDAFHLDIRVPEPFLSYKIPHLSLQPLLENAVKHNAATSRRPLRVEIYTMFDHLVISNNLWEIPEPETSNGVGLVNLNERFKIMLQKEIEIEKRDGLFIVKLPLEI